MTATHKTGRGRKPGSPTQTEDSKTMQAVIDRLGPSVFVGVLDIDGTLRHANQSALDAIGVKPEEVLEHLKAYEDKIPDWMWTEIVKLTDLRLTFG